MRTETDVQNLSILAIEAGGGWAGRNNSGVAREVDERTGELRPVRYGLANTSAKFNAVFKTGDLVGVWPEQVLTNGTHYPVPVTIGIFCMWECKKPGWRFSLADDRARAQWNAIQHVRRFGGRAGFVTHPDQAVAIARGLSGGAYDGS